VHTEADGGPLGIAISGANTPDCKLLAVTLDAIVVERPRPTEQDPQNLSLDKGYDNPTSEEALDGRGYTLHIRRIGQEKFNELKQKKYPARRWVVERTLAWLSRCRAILVRYDKKAENYLALLKLACALLWFRRAYKLNAF
jgi:putative transposase